MSSHTLDSLFAQTKTHVRRVMGPKFELEKLTVDASFAELGVDSLYLTEVSFALLTELDVYVPMAQVARTKTVREFLEVVLAAL
jgi:acyl carrier protein